MAEVAAGSSGNQAVRSDPGSGGQEDADPGEQAAAFDVKGKLVPYLSAVVPPILDVAADTLTGVLSSALPELERFASDAQTPVLVVRHTLPESDDADATAGELMVELGVRFAGPKTRAIALIKRAASLDSARSAASQLQLVHFGEGSPLETLHAYVHHSFAPYINSFASASAAGAAAGGDGVTGTAAGAAGAGTAASAPGAAAASAASVGTATVRKRIAELEVSLRAAQQLVSIPEVVLPIEPAIRAAVQACEARGERPRPEQLGDQVHDKAFLDALTANVQRWVREVNRLSKLEYDPASGTASQEIQFWSSLERALTSLDTQLKSSEVDLTITVLKQERRFHATVGFDQDRNKLADLVARVASYNSLLKDFPIDELLSAVDAGKIRDALTAIFTHFRRLRSSSYPVWRALRLVEAISRAFAAQVLKVLSDRRPLTLPFDEFHAVMSQCQDLFAYWDEQVAAFRDLARSQAKRFGERNVVIRIASEHEPLQRRVNMLYRFRKQHEDFQSVIANVLPRTGDGQGVVDQVRKAFQLVRHVDVLDLSKEGTDIWETAMRTYDERITQVEVVITTNLRDRLGTASNANEMFLVFSKFNALFFRPRIRGAIQEFQTQLIERVKEDISKLHDKFKKHYAASEAAKVSQLRDVPPVAGAIVWARQIERQLLMYLSRVEDILGQGWESHVEGAKLKSDGDSFRRKLSTSAIFDNWVKHMESRKLEVSGRLFEVARSGSALSLHVHFDPEVIVLFKEVRFLHWLGFMIPFQIQLVSTGAKQVYPFAVSLMESVRTYTTLCRRITPEIEPLVAAMRKEVQELIADGFKMNWQSHKLSLYAKKLGEAVNSFEERVADLLVRNDALQADVAALATVPLNGDALGKILARVQHTVDDLNLGGYSNLIHWAGDLDERIEETLRERLQQAVQAWIDEFDRLIGASQDDEAVEATARALRRRRRRQRRRARRRGRGGDGDDADGDDDDDDDNGPLGVRDILRPSVHTLRMRNRTMLLDPPLQQARVNWYQQFHEYLDIVCRLPRLQSSRYELGAGADDADGAGTAAGTYSRALLHSVSSGVLVSAYERIEKQLDEVSEYVATWLRYQALWDMTQEQVFQQLGDDVERWHSMLDSIKRSRATFDTSASERAFGPLVIDYRHVQGKVTSQYDAWHKDVLNAFGAKLGTAIHTLHASLSTARSSLEESPPVEAATTADAVGILTQLQDLRVRLRTWGSEIDRFAAGQRLLERQRFHFPNDWLHFDMLSGEWHAFNEIMERKAAAITAHIPTLQSKVVSEDRTVAAKIKELHAEWNKDKPLAGDVRPGDALDVIQIFEGRISRLEQENTRLVQAKQALDMEVNKDSQAMLVQMQEDTTDLRAVWAALADVWTRIDALKEIAWSAVLPRKVRTELEALLTALKELPNNVRSYAAYEYVFGLIKTYLKVNILIVDLKSEALRDRHWKELRKRLNASWLFGEMTLGSVWDANLLKHEKIVKEVISRAQSEVALEEYLRSVRDTWQTYQLDMVAYHDKVWLIRGWDDLFTKVGEHLGGLSAMKASPSFKEFEEEALGLEDKLNRVHQLFDCWIDVQRRWVYLEGIFSGSGDIRQLLPQETQRFRSIDNEFMGVMKKVHKSRMVLDVLAIEGIQRSLERLADLLTKIQKALGEYLERQRSAFPRFYFIGDEDLLEIIGNSKDIVKIQKHLRKLFAGVSLVHVANDGCTITGMGSRQGEVVPFHAPVVVKEDTSIHQWLTALETEMRVTLALLLAQAVAELAPILAADSLPVQEYNQWMDRFPAQLVVLASQINWSAGTEAALDKSKSAAPALAQIERVLAHLTDSVLDNIPPARRVKIEQLITEMVHQRDVVRKLVAAGVDSSSSFAWLYEMRFYWNPSETVAPADRLDIRVANATFKYGFEYLGVMERLVQTPLTDRCYLTLTQALHSRLGGNPFGPAGTGKTETVKALGAQLGRFVLVFNCDESFDFQAMGRIFVGLCQVGAWGCFDEFNRLEERILSATSQQILQIQTALKAEAPQVELLDHQVRLNQDMGIFITMNPGYAGRSNLPDNLKQLFRSIAMIVPDRELIAQVMLFAQGFRSAETLASKVVPLFKLCSEQLSAQSHYDFGLRALKSVLTSAGNLRRAALVGSSSDDGDNDAAAATATDDRTAAQTADEQQVLIRSICETMIPKLVAADIPLLYSLLSDVFPRAKFEPLALDELRKHVRDVCDAQCLVYGDAWVDKLLQLYQIQGIHHGVMMVGPSGSGKTTAWSVLLEAMDKLTGIKHESYVMDPKAISKEQLYGVLDSTTRDWTDGLFTHTMRKVIDNVRGEADRVHWIIFDGDVDPEWVESLNSLLDDNKMLTLPNGERLALPPNIRIMFEVQDLRYATLATVSRCGMVWFSDETLPLHHVMTHYLDSLCKQPLLQLGDEHVGSRGGGAVDLSSPAMLVQIAAAEVLRPYFAADGLAMQALQRAQSMSHIMDFTAHCGLTSVKALLNKGIAAIVEYNAVRVDFPMDADRQAAYMSKRLLFALLWGFGGAMRLADRQAFSEFLQASTTIPLPDAGVSILDCEVSLADAAWAPWRRHVPQVEVETHKVAASDVVIPTQDTVRHTEVIQSWLADRRPLVLCGPPGSGKTMTLTATLRSLPDHEFVGLNFSSTTTPELLLQTFEQYCTVSRTPVGLVMRPTQPGKWLVVFCDEVNLPAEDAYGTQRATAFIRQLAEKRGFWRTSDLQWVRLERVQFVGACNPPTDPGRVALSHRFLRHAPILMVDFPSAESLCQIYGTFNRALLKLSPPLRAHAEPLTNAMVALYQRSQRRFVPDMHAHYVYSPRELSRWVRGMAQAMRQMDGMLVEDLVRLWAHEALRLFQDRLVDVDEREWTDTLVDEVAGEFFPGIDITKALTRPILYSNWLSKAYVPVPREELREHVQARLKAFYEEELDVPLVVFDEVLDHILRIDRVMRQPQGHALLIGVSGGGKTVLSRFVAWMNGLSVFQIKVSKRYTGDDFDEDLRHVMRRCGLKGEKICFIFDESNVLESSFLERMNALLASGEVPGLFEGEEWSSLMHACKEAAQSSGVMLDTEDELYHWFTQQVQVNLHVVFTMNPASPDFHNRTATSPALFNRCVLDWFGEWSPNALFQVGTEFTRMMDLDEGVYEAPAVFPRQHRLTLLPEEPGLHQSLVSALVYVHGTIHAANQRLSKEQGRHNYVTPRHYLDFIKHVTKLYHEKRQELEEQQLHLTQGLKKLAKTEAEVKDLQGELAAQNAELDAKNREAEAKLKQMLQDQQAAEEKRKDSIEIKKEVEKQNVVISEQREVALKDLAQAEPAVEDAKAAVGQIKKPQMDEVRGMANPPPMVKKTLDAVVLMLYGKREAWDAIRKLIRRDDFIPSILTFDSETLSQKVRDMLKKEWLDDPSFTFETVNRASRAAGPLCKWIRAQVMFSTILHSIEPLRQEVAKLERAAEEQQKKADELDAMISELESSIARYKDEYAALISETQRIKATMEATAAKAERCTKLLHNLQGEQGRWSREQATFQAQMSTLLGDVLVSSAFLSYLGFYDQRYRQRLLRLWSEHLDAINLTYKQDLDVVEYLAHSDRRLEWHNNKLPADALCEENAIMLERFNRYPLVIDPSGQATDFLMTQHADRKIMRTSFLDASFLKHLEAALRFGTVLLVQDVETIDPILNPVLNKEIHKQGGRILIRLGDQDIDFSPTFNLFLTTRDPTASFTPDLCSRVTFVNFTVTPSSLESQCLHRTLKSERPDVDQKRSDLLKAQGAFRVRLRNLEAQLLLALSDTKGSIVDDDTVLGKLETLKSEAAGIEAQVADTDRVMAEVMAVTDTYKSLAQSCARVYFTLEQLGQTHFLYQFSLKFFLDIFDQSVLHNNDALDGVTEAHDRLAVLKRTLFAVTFRQVACGLLQDDQRAFALRLAQIAAADAPHGHNDVALAAWSHLMRPVAAAASAVVVAGGAAAADVALPADVFDADQTSAVSALIRALPSVFAELPQRVAADTAAWTAFAQGSASQPVPWDAASAPGVPAGLQRLLVIKAVRPDRALASLDAVVQPLLGETFRTVVPDVDLSRVVQHESQPHAPLVLCSFPGYDASHRVVTLATSLGRALSSVAIGTSESYVQAEAEVVRAVKQGTWVLLKNVHLAARWLASLEKKLHTLNYSNPAFRLFLTMEINPAVPSNLLRQSSVFVFEPPPGVRANLQRSLAIMPVERMDRQPAERSRLYVLLAWLHALVQERLRYAPLGWSKRYEFNESDERCAIDMIDVWVDRLAAGRSNLPANRIPWAAISTILSESVYGGRVDNDFDQRLLASIVRRLFSEQSFGADFRLVDAPDLQLGLPESMGRDAFAQWIDSALPETGQSPVWLGLPADAEKMLLRTRASHVLTMLQRIQSAYEDEGVASEASEAGLLAAAAAPSTPVSPSAATTASSSAAPPVPAWIDELSGLLTAWDELLPADVPELPRSEASIGDPLFRFIDREVRTAARVLTIVRRDLRDLQHLCRGDVKMTNTTRALVARLTRCEIPESWRSAYAATVDALASRDTWIADFAARLTQLIAMATPDAAGRFCQVPVWLGGLFSPEAYITATRQAAAQSKQWSLEEIVLTVAPASSPDAPSGGGDTTSFVARALTLEGASWSDAGAVSATGHAAVSLPPLLFTWVHQSQQSEVPAGARVHLPVYVDRTRQRLLFAIDVPTVDTSAGLLDQFYQRGAALF